MPGDNEGGAPRGPRFDPAAEEDKKPRNPNIDYQCDHCNKIFYGPHAPMELDYQTSYIDENGHAYTSEEQTAAGLKSGPISHGGTCDECMADDAQKRGLEELRTKHGNPSLEETRRMMAESRRVAEERAREYRREHGIPEPGEG